MSAGRLFTISLLVAAVCLALFQLLTPGLLVRDPKSFDARIGGYDIAAVRDYIAYLDANGLKNTYLTTFRWIDSVFPLALCGMLASAIWGLWARPAKLIALAGIVVALTYLGVDYAENAAVATMIRTGFDEELVARASLLTQVKWGAIIVCALLAAAGLGLTLIKGGRR